MLDINLQSIYQSNKTTTFQNSSVFGLSWIGDGASIKWMLLLNMLAMCGGKPPVVIAIFHCTGHLMDGEMTLLNSSHPFSNPRLMSLIQEKHLLTNVSLMGQHMFWKCGKSCVHTSQGQFISMEWNLFYYYYLVTCHYFGAIKVCIFLIILFHQFNLTPW